MGSMFTHLVTDVNRCVQADENALIRHLRAGKGGEPCAGTDHSQLLLCARTKDHSFIQHPTVFLEPCYIPNTTVGGWIAW